MTTLKIKDNTATPKEAFKGIPGLVEATLSKNLKELEQEGIFVFPEFIKEAQGLTQDQMILVKEKNRYRTSNVMGFLGKGQEKLAIESRFSTGKEDYFFQYLIEKVLDIPYVINLHTDIDNEDNILRLLMFLFPFYLKKAMRKGIYKVYLRREYNDANIKGSIDVARHIKYNTPFLGKVAYSQREFSYDNDMTELIRHTIEFIKRKPVGGTLLRSALDEVSAIISVTNEYNHLEKHNIIEANKKTPIRHAYYKEYRELQRLCLMILKDEKHGIGSNQDKINGILFDGAWLFEEYINILVSPYFYHPENKGGKGAQRLFAQDLGPNIGLIYPDFLGRNPKQPVVADAKYKPIKNIGNKDYLQVLAYMFRFDAKVGLYFYPESQGLEDQVLYLNQGNTYERTVRPRGDIKVIKQGLVIPSKVENYSDFCRQMEQAEKQFITNILNVIH